MKNETQKHFISTREAIQLTGLHAHTIRKYADQQQIQCYKTPSGQRKYNRACLEKFCNPVLVAPAVQQNEKLHFIYSRVSSKKQLDDLSRQTQYLQQARPEYASYLSITDVASGINFKRKGLQTILDSCLQGTLGEVVIAHRDRLCRFGFDLLEYIIQKNGGKITVLDHDSNKSSEQELAEDLLSIVNIYSSNQMAKRSYSRRTVQGTTNQDETLSESEEHTE